MLPLKKMPRHGGDWPLVEDMVATNQRLIVFTSNISKEETEGIAYTWNFMVECKCKRITLPNSILLTIKKHTHPHTLIHTADEHMLVNYKNVNVCSVFLFYWICI